MSQAYQQKLDRFHARYTNDTSLPPDQAIELCADLHDLVSVLSGRLTRLEEQVTALTQKMG